MTSDGGMNGVGVNSSKLNTTAFIQAVQHKSARWLTKSAIRELPKQTDSNTCVVYYLARLRRQMVDGSDVIAACVGVQGGGGGGAQIV